MADFGLVYEIRIIIYFLRLIEIALAWFVME